MRICAVCQDLGFLFLASSRVDEAYFMVFVTRGTFNVARLPSISPLHRPSVRPTATEEGPRGRGHRHRGALADAGQRSAAEGQGREWRARGCH